MTPHALSEEDAQRIGYLASVAFLAVADGKQEDSDAAIDGIIAIDGERSLFGAVNSWVAVVKHLLGMGVRSHVAVQNVFIPNDGAPSWSPAPEAADLATATSSIIAGCVNGDIAGASAVWGTLNDEQRLKAAKLICGLAGREARHGPPNRAERRHRRGRS